MLAWGRVPFTTYCLIGITLIEKSNSKRRLGVKNKNANVGYGTDIRGEKEEHNCIIAKSD